MLPWGLLFAASAVSWFLVPRGPRRSWRFDEDAELVMYAARFMATGGRVRPEHVAAAALFDPRVPALLAGREPRVSIAESEFWTRLVHARASGEITVGDIVRALQLSTDENALKALDEIRPVDVSTRRAADETVESGDVDVYIVNDDKTTMDFVVNALVEDWQLDRPRAAFAMREADRKGHGLVGRFSVADARARRARTQARGSQLEFLLLVP
jgi:ATP-dependent Clp protease adapter protein ClpS